MKRSRFLRVASHAKHSLLSGGVATLAVGLFFFLALAAATIVVVRQAHAAPPFPGLHASTIVQTEYWKARIAQVGGEAAYQEFATDVAGAQPSDQHLGAHAFGGALYEVEGLPGLTVCDARFSYGCFHQFLGEAIASLGLSVVTQLNQQCFQVKGVGLACQHGIGHGILASLGYNYTDLTKSLDVCKDLPFIDPIGGCYGGVFMEYNLQTMLGQSGRVRLATKDLLAPCDSLSAVYEPACYFNQAQWWFAHFDGWDHQQGDAEADSVFAKIGSLCAQVPSNARQDCFEGIGNEIPPSAKYDPTRAKQLCIDATSDPQDQLYCREFAANSITVGGAGNLNGNGLPVCDGLTGVSYQECSDYATNKANLAQPPSPQQEDQRQP